MIPNAVFNHVMNSSNYNHGAELKRDNKSFLLGSEFVGTKCIIVATMHLEVASNDELLALERQGYDVQAGTTPEFEQAHPTCPSYRPVAWKRIKLVQVPDSRANEWETWDEY